MFGVSRFKDKVAVIAGAGHPVGRSLCLRLAAFGATVVALDRNEEMLLALARRAPQRIEPLTVLPGRRDVLELLREAWGSEPLDYFADFWPLLRRAQDVPPQETFGSSAGLALALMAGLQAGQGLGLLALPQSSPSGGSEHNDLSSVGYETLLMRLSKRAVPARLMGLRLPETAVRWTEPECTSAGDLALTLFHPVSRGLRNGSVLDWAHHETQM